MAAKVAIAATIVRGMILLQINFVCVKICDFGWNHKISSCSNRAKRVMNGRGLTECRSAVDVG